MLANMRRPLDHDDAETRRAEGSSGLTAGPTARGRTPAGPRIGERGEALGDVGELGILLAHPLEQRAAPGQIAGRSSRSPERVPEPQVVRLGPAARRPSCGRRSAIASSQPARSASAPARRCGPR